MAPLRTERQRAPRPFEGSRASPEEDGGAEEDDDDEGGGMANKGASQGGEEGSCAEDGFALEEVLRLGGTKQDFIMLAALGEPEELVDGGKRGAIDDLKPGELQAFIRGLGLGSFPESCRLQEEEEEEEEGEDAGTHGGETAGSKKGAKAMLPQGKEPQTSMKGAEAPHISKRKEAPGKQSKDASATKGKEARAPKKGGESPGTKSKEPPVTKAPASGQWVETPSLDVKKGKRVKKDQKKPLQLNEVSSTSEVAKKPARQDIFEFYARPTLLVKPGGKWYDMDYAKEFTSELQDGVQVSNYKALAQKLYQHEAELYRSKKDQKKGASYAWMKTVVSAGTLADRMAAMTLLIQDAPVHTLQFIESLVNLIRKKGSRRQCLMALDTFKELLLSDLLPDHRKLVIFSQHPFDKLEMMSSGNRDARDRRLILWYFEHQLKHQVAEFVQVLETLSHDTLLATKARALMVAHELLCNKPEEEKALLVQLVNKLGDPQYRIATKACYLMETLLQKHPNMKGVVCHEVERLLYRPNISAKAQYYGICFLNQTILSHEESDLANKLITVYFCFFRTCIKKKDMESKMLRALLTGVNRAFPYAQIGNEKVTEQLNTLFKIVHLVNFNTSVQVFMLLFQVMDSQQTVSHRYYAALYKKLLDPGLAHCSKQSMFLNLVYKSLKADVELRRVKAFVKRLLQVTCGSMAPFICGALYLVSEILKLKPGLRALLQEQGESDEEEHFKDLADDENVTDQDQETKTKEEIKVDSLIVEGTAPAASWVHLQTLKGGMSSSNYDPLNRNPLFCGADCTGDSGFAARVPPPAACLALSSQSEVMAGAARSLWCLVTRVGGARAAAAAYGTGAQALSPRAGPCHSSQAPVEEGREAMWAQHSHLKRMVHDLLPPGVCSLVTTSNVYANNEVSLANIEVYGFDYDYTLALYSNALHTMIFNTARDILVKQYKYPEGILKYDYIPDFAIRGLHYDIPKGLLMKIDAFHYIQLGTVYRGLKPVPDDEVMDLFQGTHIPLHQVSGFYGKGPSLKQFMDIFSLPEMTLLAVANDFFVNNKISYDPIHLYKDVSDAIGDVHIKGLMYQWIMQDLEKYILRGGETYSVLHQLAAEGKKLFLITNSPFSFVDKGMRYMVGEAWRDFFDVVIVQADKPNFFNGSVKPFRSLDRNGDLRWDKITQLEKGQVYKQGNLVEFLKLTGWRGSKVLYFGDHLYSDLADLMLRHGWRTGAIVPELETETKIVSTELYVSSLTWLQALTGLVERLQIVQQPESIEVLEEWKKERLELRAVTKNLFNPQFGSLFRTDHNPTYFSRRLCRFSDLYMGSISCLTNYSSKFTFYPRRTPLQHEAPLWMDQLCTGCMKTPFLQEMAHIR